MPPWKGRTDDGYGAEAEVSVWPRQFRSADQLTAAFEARLDDAMRATASRVRQASDQAGP